MQPRSPSRHRAVRTSGSPLFGAEGCWQIIASDLVSREKRCRKLELPVVPVVPNSSPLVMNLGLASVDIRYHSETREDPEVLLTLGPTAANSGCDTSFLTVALHTINKTADSHSEDCEVIPQRFPNFLELWRPASVVLIVFNVASRVFSSGGSTFPFVRPFIPDHNTPVSRLEPMIDTEKR